MARWNATSNELIEERRTHLVLCEGRPMNFLVTLDASARGNGSADALRVKENGAME